MDESKTVRELLAELSDSIDGLFLYAAVIIALILVVLIMFQLTSYGDALTRDKRLVALIFSPLINFFLLVRLRQLPFAAKPWSIVFRVCAIAGTTYFLATL